MLAVSSSSCKPAKRRANASPSSPAHKRSGVTSCSATVHNVSLYAFSALPSARLVRGPMIRAAFPQDADCLRWRQFSGLCLHRRGGSVPLLGEGAGEYLLGRRRVENPRSASRSSVVAASGARVSTNGFFRRSRRLLGGQPSLATSGRDRINSAGAIYPRGYPHYRQYPDPNGAFGRQPCALGLGLV